MNSRPDIAPAARSRLAARFAVALVVVATMSASWVFGLADVVAPDVAFAAVPDGAVARWALVAAALVSAAIALAVVAPALARSRAAERALRENAEHLHGIGTTLADAVAVVPAGFTLYDSAERVVLTNRNVCVAPVAEVGPLIAPGTHIEEIVRRVAESGQVPAAIGREEDWISRRLACFRHPRGRFAFELADGRWIEIINSKTADGGTVSIRTDITARKERERALRESEARFRALVDAAPAAIFLADRQSRIRLANRTYEELIDRPRAKALGRTPAEFLLAGARETAMAGNMAVMRDKVSIAGERVRRHPNGTLHTWHLTKFPVLDDDGEVIAIGGIGFDMTEFKRTEQALRESEERYRKLIELSLDAVFVRAGARYVFANPAAARLLGAPSADDLVGKEWLTFDHPDERERARKRFGEALSGRPSAGFIERRLRRLDGGEVHVETGGVPISWNGAPAVLSVMRDITGRKRAERAQRAAKEEAERANAAKTRFLAAASHDLRQPLQALEFLVSALEGRLPDGRDRGLVEKMDRSVVAMSGLLDTLLDISKLEAGAVTPKVRAFAVGRMLDNVRDTFAPQAAERGIAFRVVATRAVVRSDPALLERLVQNFASNAVRHTDAGAVLLGCRRRGAHLRIEVWDTGKGIAKDKQDSIFEEFFQIDNAARDRRLGFGLGLAIVKRLGRLLDHPIALASTPGRGSVFSVTVPLSAELPAEAGPETGRESDAVAASGAYVVLIDDEPDVSAALEMMLRVAGFDVLAAASAAEAAARLAGTGRRPDVIISDYRLRGGRVGTDAIRALHQAIGAPVPGIILTGDTMPERLIEARQSGFRLVHKPVRSAQLKALVAELLG